MITVVHSDGADEFDDATKVRTDEHNNLEVYEGKPGGERLAYLFNRSEWREAVIHYD